MSNIMFALISFLLSCYHFFVFLLNYFLGYEIAIIDLIDANFVALAIFFANSSTFLFLITLVLTSIYILYILHSILSSLVRYNLI